MEGLLGADLVGFQVHGAASNFSRLARRVVGASGTDAVMDYEGRQVHVGAFADIGRFGRANHARLGPGGAKQGPPASR